MSHKCRIVVLLFLFPEVVGYLAQDKASRLLTEPQIISLFPSGGRPGKAFEAEVRGRILTGAYAVWSHSDGVTAHVTKVDDIELGGTAKEGAHGERYSVGQRVVLQVKIDPTGIVGAHSLRLVTPQGISDALTFFVTNDPVIAETQTRHHTPDTSQPLAFPVLVNGRIGQQGELDYYAIDVSQGQELTFEVVTTSGGKDFHPILSLYDSARTWLDPHEATWLISSRIDSGKSELTYRFIKQGRYLVRVGSLLDKGSPDYVYQLRIAQGKKAELVVGNQRATDYPYWQERVFIRKLEESRLEALRARTVVSENYDKVPSGPNTPVEASSSGDDQEEALGGAFPTSKLVVRREMEPNETPEQALKIPLPAVAEGKIDHFGDVDTFRFKVESGRAMAFEIETPDSTIPSFNPRLGVLDPGGHEILTNIHKMIWVLKREAPSMTSPAYLKTLEPKVIETFEHAGEYCVQIREMAARAGSYPCSYRVLIRPQLPHLGETKLIEDCINLAPGEAKKATVIMALEEGFKGNVAIRVENLPEAVQALPGTEVVPSNAGPTSDGYASEKAERFEAQNRKVTIVFAARGEAPVTTMPVMIRVTSQPIVNDKLGPVLEVGRIPMMVVSREKPKPRSK